MTGSLEAAWPLICLQQVHGRQDLQESPRFFLFLRRNAKSRYGVIQKKCSKGIFESFDCLEKKEFLQWNTRTKNYLCVNFQDIWSSSKSWKFDIKYSISARKMHIWNKRFCKKNPYIVIVDVSNFHLSARSSSFFSHFFFNFTGHFFMNDPVSRKNLRME